MTPSRTCCRASNCPSCCFISWLMRSPSSSTKSGRLAASRSKAWSGTDQSVELQVALTVLQEGWPSRSSTRKKLAPGPALIGAAGRNSEKGVYVQTHVGVVSRPCALSNLPGGGSRTAIATCG